jgi:RHS repeat-associated protein
MDKNLYFYFSKASTISSHFSTLLTKGLFLNCLKFFKFEINFINIEIIPFLMEKRLVGFLISFLVLSMPVAFAYQEYSLTYDGNGNLITGDGKFRVYNDFNQLIEVYSGNDTSGEVLEFYLWHPTEDRILVKKVFNGSVYPEEVVVYVNDNFDKSYTNPIADAFINETYYVYDDYGLVGEEIYNTTFRGTDDHPVFPATFLKKIFYHSDHLGSTTVITNSSGGVVEKTFYDPYGEIISGGEIGRYQYEGKEFSEYTQDYDFNFRKYDPELGIFTQPDAVLVNVYDPQQLNRYSFERRNPYGYVDKDGKYIETAVDVAFIAYDLHELKKDPILINFVILGADIAGSVLPFATGVGVGVKTAIKSISEGKLFSKLTPREIGLLGEKELLERFGGESQKFFRTSIGKGRIFDQFSPNTGIARESKVGYQTLTQSNRIQIDKTAELISSGKISGAENYFFTSPVTGKGGASGNLLNYATSKGIKNIQETAGAIKNTLNKIKSFFERIF